MVKSPLLVPYRPQKSPAENQVHYLFTLTGVKTPENSLFDRHPSFGAGGFGKVLNKKQGVALAIGKWYDKVMLCSVCGLNELTGKQLLYCSKNCERKGWRDKNKEKLLLGKRLYREANKDKIAVYDKLYKSKVKQIKESLANRLKATHSCLRCGTNMILEVHHIKSQLLGGEPNDLNNVVVLCKSCHARWHQFFNKDYWKI